MNKTCMECKKEYELIKPDLSKVSENDPRFLKRIASARQSLRAGKGILIEDLTD